MDASSNELLESPQTYETLGIRALDRRGHGNRGRAVPQRAGADAGQRRRCAFGSATAMNMMGDAERARRDSSKRSSGRAGVFPGPVQPRRRPAGEGAARARRSNSSRPRSGSAPTTPRRGCVSHRVCVRLGRAPRSAARTTSRWRRRTPIIVEAQVGYAMTLARLGRDRRRGTASRQAEHVPSRRADLRATAGAPPGRLRRTTASATAPAR